MVIASATSSETSPWKIFLLGLLSFGTIVNTSVTTLLCRKEFIAQTARTQLKIALAFYSAQQRWIYSLPHPNHRRDLLSPDFVTLIGCCCHFFYLGTYCCIISAMLPQPSIVHKQSKSSCVCVEECCVLVLLMNRLPFKGKETHFPTYLMSHTQAKCVCV